MLSKLNKKHFLHEKSRLSTYVSFVLCTISESQDVYEDTRVAEAPAQDVYDDTVVQEAQDVYDDTTPPEQDVYTDTLVNGEPLEEVYELDNVPASTPPQVEAEPELQKSGSFKKSSKSIKSFFKKSKPKPDPASTAAADDSVAEEDEKESSGGSLKTAATPGESFIQLFCSN